MRRIAVMVGSDSDLAQCVEGLEYLRGAVLRKRTELLQIYTCSIHLNTDSVLRKLRRLHSSHIDVLIVGAGWANHLTGIVDAYLRNGLNDGHIVVVGVAFEDRENPEHTKAAISGITEVPGTQVAFDEFVGPKGFLRACKLAVEGNLPTIECRPYKQPKNRSLGEALHVAQLMRDKAERT